MRIKRLIDEARKAGARITEDDAGTTIRRKGCAVRIWKDGTATRYDVDLTLATRMTIAQAAQVLGIKEA